VVDLLRRNHPFADWPANDLSANEVSVAGDNIEVSVKDNSEATILETEPRVTAML
jgi:hypothetical protein